MPQIVCNIALDVAVNNIEQMLSAKQGDTQNRLLCVTFTDCGKPLPIEKDAVVLLNVKSGEARASFEGTVTKEGKALFAIPDFVLVKAGSVQCDVSAITPNGGRLTTAAFGILVEPAICPSGEVSNDAAVSDLAADFIASQRLLTLTPQPRETGYVIAPEINHKYCLDLSDSRYAPGGVWANFRLELPVPTNATKENWILIYCHAPITAEAGAVSIDFGSDCLFADARAPMVSLSDFDIVCTYSRGAGCWQVGVVQYAKQG
ncbi:MAG: hypothetical protein E7585_04420 [Ruminococcaceae bacterium]|nr:hypothetical protein [Oscillospiraceae bacterium]